MVRWHGLVWSALLGAALLAGCAGNAAPQEPLGPETGNGLFAPASGHVRGQVHADSGLPLQGARVLLAGTSLSDLTDVRGAYAFDNVTAGTYILRVEASGYRVHEQEVTVAAGAVLERHITVVPQETRGAGSLPHLHDYWAGETQITIMDESVDLTTRRVGSTTADAHPVLNDVSARALYANAVYPQYIIPVPQSDGKPNIVYPGADRVEVTFTWNDAPPMPPAYGFGYAPANDNDRTNLGAGGSGTTWSIDVTPEMTDAGHQAFTLWEFLIIPVNDARNAPDYRPALVTEEVHVTITVFKGDSPPPEPGHPTFWDAGDELLLRDHSNLTRTRTPPSADAMQCSPEFRLDEGFIVPPGTARLLMELKRTYTDVGSTPLDEEHSLFWNTGAYNPSFRRPAEYGTAEATARPDANTIVYELDLEPGQTDAFYQTKSAWRWFACVTGEQADFQSDFYRAREWTLKVVAVRDPSTTIQ